MTALTPHETEITLDPKVPSVRITREFDAPREKVFRAHVQPELAARWLGPRDLEMDIDHDDARTGGSYRYTHRDADPGGTGPPPTPGSAPAGRASLQRRSHV